VTDSWKRRIEDLQSALEELQAIPDDLAAGIIEDLQSALDELQAISDDLARTAEAEGGIDEVERNPVTGSKKGEVK